MIFNIIENILKFMMKSILELTSPFLKNLIEFFQELREKITDEKKLILYQINGFLQKTIF